MIVSIRSRAAREDRRRTLASRVAESRASAPGKRDTGLNCMRHNQAGAPQTQNEELLWPSRRAAGGAYGCGLSAATEPCPPDAGVADAAFALAPDCAAAIAAAQPPASPSSILSTN